MVRSSRSQIGKVGGSPEAIPPLATPESPVRPQAEPGFLYRTSIGSLPKY